VIDFRYHVVSIVAVFLALTVGLVLGASFLKGAAVTNLKDSITSLTTQRNNLQQANRTQGNQMADLNTYISETAPIAVQNYLDGYNVSVVQINGSDPALTSATLTYLADAGAKVTSDYTINPSFTATDAATETKLSDTVDSSLPGGQLPGTGTAAVQAADLLAEALTAPVETDTQGGVGNQSQGQNGAGSGAQTQTQTQTPASEMTPGEAQAVLVAFGTGGFITKNTVPANLTPAAAARPTLAFIAAPTTVNTAAQNVAYISLAEALRGGGAAPVVGGAAADNTPGSSQTGGLLDAVLKDGTANKQVATVDNINLTTGQVAVVFTLWQAANNAATGSNAAAGHWGSVGTNQGQLPPLTPLPTPTPTSTPTSGSTATPGGKATTPAGHTATP
jgi:Copper transport outer membrane protein, MctB